MSFPPHMPMMPPMPFFPPMMIPPPNLSTPPPGMPPTGTNSTQKPGDNEKKGRPQGATTVFVGSISDRAPDVMIKRMLQLCGDVANWKRIQDANGKLQAFGFCEYENPEGTLRCIRLLNGYQIQDKKLLVKVDAKTKVIIDEYKKKKRRELAKKAAKDMTAFKLLYEEEDEEKTDGNSTNADGKKKSGEEGEIEEDDDDYIDNDTRREDSAIKQAIETVMREYSREMNLKALEAKEQAQREAQMAAAAPPPAPPSSVPVAGSESPTSDDQSAPPDTQRVDPAAALENEEEKRSLITNEIQLFRHRFKDEETKMRNTEKERRDRYERERALQREKRTAAESAKSPSSPNDDRHRSSSSRHHTSNSIRSLTNDRRTTPSRYDRRSPRSYHRRSRTKSPASRSHRNDDNDDEETIERKRQERRIREKENIYRDRLKTWEQRERKRRSDYQAEKDRELLRLRDEEKERKRSLTFHESYKDDTHDFIYYKGTALARRIKDREREIELDKRDRQREKEEIQDLKKKLTAEGKYEDIELEIKQRLQKEEETIRKRLADLVKAESDMSSEESDAEQNTKKKSSSSIKKEIPEETKTKEQSPQPAVKTEPTQKYREESPPPTSALGGAPITAAKIVSKRRLARNEAFGDDQEDDHATTQPKKSKLSAIPDRQSPIAQPVPVPVKKEEPPPPPPPPAPAPVAKNPDANSLRAQEEKRQAVCKLIESIPTKKEDLFTFPLDWSLLDSTLMEKRIKPWVTKKIVEYLGEEEPALTDFICTSIMSKKNAETIVNDVRVVLDNEADVFVVKMWRLIVYEIEAKRNGLSK